MHIHIIPPRWRPAAAGPLHHHDGPFARQSCTCTGIVAECAQTMHTAATATTGALDDLARVSASSRRLTWSGKAADMFHARMRQFDTTIAGHLDCCATTGAMLKAGLP